MVKVILLSLDSGTDAQCAALWNEVERVLGHTEDPLDILIAEEEEFDVNLAITYLNGLHRLAKGRNWKTANDQRGKSDHTEVSLTYRRK